MALDKLENEDIIQQPTRIQVLRKVLMEIRDLSSTCPGDVVFDLESQEPAL